MVIFMIGMLTGMLVGCVLWTLILRHRSIGSLRVDTSDSDNGPYLFLELSKNIGDVYRKKYITLKVNTQSYLPHK